MHTYLECCYHMYDQLVSVKPCDSMLLVSYKSLVNLSSKSFHGFLLEFCVDGDLCCLFVLGFAAYGCADGSTVRFQVTLFL